MKKDELNKYVYPLYIKEKNNTTSTKHATGFFVNFKEKTYFMTNYHVFPDMDPNTLIINNKVESIYIILNKINSQFEPNTIELDSFDILDNISKFYFFEHPDLFILDVSKSEYLPLINSIDFDYSINEFNIGDTAVVIGYPSKDFAYQIIHQTKGSVSNNYSDFSSLGFKFNVVDPSFINYLRQRYSIFFYYVKAEGYPGMSGGPVFSTLNGIDYKLCGIHSNSYDYVKYSAFIRLDIILYYLNHVYTLKLNYSDYSIIPQIS